MGLRLRGSELLRQHVDMVLLLQILKPEQLNFMLQLLDLWIKLH